MQHFQNYITGGIQTKNLKGKFNCVPYRPNTRNSDLKLLIIMPQHLWFRYTVFIWHISVRAIWTTAQFLSHYATRWVAEESGFECRQRKDFSLLQCPDPSWVSSMEPLVQMVLWGPSSDEKRRKREADDSSNLMSRVGIITDVPAHPHAFMACACVNVQPLWCAHAWMFKHTPYTTEFDHVIY